MFPRFLMSETMQKLGLVTFNAWALDGYLKVFWREAPLVDALAPGLAVLVALTTVSSDAVCAAVGAPLGENEAADVSRQYDVALVRRLVCRIVSTYSLRLIRRAAAVGLDDRQQLALDVGGHAFLVAADEELGALLEPGPEIASRSRMRCCTYTFCA